MTPTAADSSVQPETQQDAPERIYKWVINGLSMRYKEDFRVVKNDVAADITDSIKPDAADSTISDNAVMNNTGCRDIDIDAQEPKKKKHDTSDLKQYQWKPGQSGNPSGKRKTPNEVRDMLKDALEDAVKTLIELSQHAEKDSVRYQAAQDLVDRVLGKPTQPLDIDQTNAVKVEFVGGTDDLAK